MIREIQKRKEQIQKEKTEYVTKRAKTNDSRSREQEKGKKKPLLLHSILQKQNFEPSKGLIDFFFFSNVQNSIFRLFHICCLNVEFKKFSHFMHGISNFETMSKRAIT
eukprot:TRINITY_DN74922_c0_g1_i1.p2 TRINITY_DN74922_c0_g1~~TRINITY_DN74922_c0_g1_i1.p2  ORF type:complete len:108 (+),score=3.22 TRINITY_DN74922_c0_g1_i1:21-344(+)